MAAILFGGGCGCRHAALAMRSMDIKQTPMLLRDLKTIDASGNIQPTSTGINEPGRWILRGAKPAPLARRRPPVAGF
jgi:hypothetical protein